MGSRTVNASRNIIFGVIYRVISLLMPFILRTVVIYFLCKEYLGLNTLFSSILDVLNIAELGFSSALVYLMYKPVADNDYDKLNALLNFYRKIYFVIGIIIGICGLAIMPFLKYLIKDQTIPDDVNIYILYLMYLTSTVVGYVTFQYRISLFHAYQRVDLSSKINGVFLLVRYIFQIVIIVLTKNYYLNILTIPVFQIIINFGYYFISKKIFPNNYPAGKVSKEIVKDVKSKVLPLVGHKLSDKALNSADSLIISSFLGLGTLALFGNYNYILFAVGAFVTTIYTSILPVIGNSIVKETNEKNRFNFKILSFSNNWIVGWCSICILCLSQWFIAHIWLDDSYLLGIDTLVLMTIYFYTFYIRKIVLMYKDAIGMWKEDALKPYVIIALNIILNIILINCLGINGILISTILINLFVALPWESRVLFKYYFKEKVSKFLFKTLVIFLEFLIIGTICYLFYTKLAYSISSLIILLLFLIFVPNLLFILLNFFTNDFKQTLGFIIKKIREMLNRLKKERN